MERLYRAGILSISEIARELNVSEANVRYHAKQNGWKRDLTQEVRQRTRTKLVESLATAHDGGSILDMLSQGQDEQIIEQAARTQVEVVRQHQKTLGEGHKLTMRMLNELDATTAYAGELQQLITSTVAPNRREGLRRAVTLAARATTLRDLATAARLWVTMERQAFNIADDRDKNADKNQQKLDELTSEELRKEILDDAKKLGLELTSQDLDEHVRSNGKIH